MGRQIVLEVVFVDGLQMAGHLLGIDHLTDAADQGQPGTEHAVGQAAAAVLVLGPFLFQQSPGLGRVAADHALDLQRVLGPEVLPLDLLDEVLAVEQLLFRAANSAFEDLGIVVDVLAQGLAHEHRGPQRAEVEAGAHAVGAPELDVVGVVVGLLEPALAAGVPRSECSKSRLAFTFGHRRRSHSVSPLMRQSR